MARTATARRHNVRKIVIDEKGGRPFILDFSIEYFHDSLSDATEGSPVHFPIDDLVVYIIGTVLLPIQKPGCV